MGSGAGNGCGGLSGSLGIRNAAQVAALNCANPMFVILKFVILMSVIVTVVTVPFVILTLPLIDSA